MKTEVTLLNGVRFAPDIHTRLHLHTGDVSATVENLVVPKVGPKVLLCKNYAKHPRTDMPTPYGTGRSTITTFQFSWDEGNPKNYASTANSDAPLLPEELGPREYGTTTLDLTSQFRLSLFIRPDTTDAPPDPLPDPLPYKLVAGMPGRFGLYQLYNHLVLRMRSASAPGYDVVSKLADLAFPDNPYTLTAGAWMFVELQWSGDPLVNGGLPMWYVNGKPHGQIGAG